MPTLTADFRFFGIALKIASRIFVSESTINTIPSTKTAVKIIDRSRKHREEEMPYLSASEEDGTFLKELAELMPDEDQSPEMDYIRSTVWEELEHALLELPDEQRAVFELTELEGIPFKEISESTGIPVNTLISRKRYAVLFLRKRLYNLYEDIL